MLISERLLLRAALTSCLCAAAITLKELNTKEQAMTISQSEMAERLAELQTRETALKSAQASLEAQVQQLHSDQQVSPSELRLQKFKVSGPTHSPASLSPWRAQSVPCQ